MNKDEFKGHDLFARVDALEAENERLRHTIINLTSSSLIKASRRQKKVDHLVDLLSELVCDNAFEGVSDWLKQEVYAAIDAETQEDDREYK